MNSAIRYLGHHTSASVFVLLLTATLSACGGGSSEDQSDNSENSPSVNEGEQETANQDLINVDGVLVTKNETGIDFGPVNDAYFVRWVDEKNLVLGFEIFFSESAGDRHQICNGEYPEMDGFTAVMTAFVVDPFQGGEDAYIFPTEENIIRDFGFLPAFADLEPGAGPWGFGEFSIQENRNELASADPDLESQAQNRTTITSASFAPGGRVVGDLSIMMFDAGTGNKSGLIEMSFDVPFACDIDDIYLTL